MDNFKRKTERLAQIANPVIKQVYENQGHMYENILIPITAVSYTHLIMKGLLTSLITVLTFTGLQAQSLPSAPN